MRKIFCALLFFVASSGAFAQFMTGNDLARLSKANDRFDQRKYSETDTLASSQYFGYIEGVFDAMRHQFPCIPAGFVAGQLVAVVTKYLNEHPEEWSFSGNYLVSKAVKNAFPCGKP